MPTVLIVGATGNIGTSAVLAARKLDYHVLAIVRNKDSADKLLTHVGSSSGITMVEADILSDDGIKGVVEKVRQGKLPAFQHVYSAAGGLFDKTSILDLKTEDMRKYMRVNFESNLFAYQATVPYLLEQNDPTSTWTLCTGASGDNGGLPAASISQGALYSLANVARVDNQETNVRFNEVYLGMFVVADVELAKQWGALNAAEFAVTYEQILRQGEVKGRRVVVNRREDLAELKFGLTG